MVRLILLLLVCLVTPGWAQHSDQDKVTVTLSTEAIGLDETAILTVRVSGMSTSIDIPEPSSREGGLQFNLVGRRISASTINGRSNSSTEVDFQIVPLRTGRHLIEPLEGTISGLPFRTPSLRLEVTDAVGATRTRTPTSSGLLNYHRFPPQPQEDDVLLEAELKPETVYKHQSTIYSLSLWTAVRLLSDPRYSPSNPVGFLRVPFEQESFRDYRSGRPYAVSRVETAFFPLNEGTYEFPAVEMSVNLGLMGGLRTLNTGAKTLKVLPLPRDGRPESFTGAVGERFDISALLKDTQIRLGQTTELSISIKGDGHLDLVPYPHLPAWDNLEKKQRSGPSSTSGESGLVESRRTYNFQLKPRQPGIYRLDGIAFSYFRPSTKRYETIAISPLEFEVLPSATQTADPVQEADSWDLPDSQRPKSELGTTVPSKPTDLRLLLALSGLLTGLVALFTVQKPNLKVAGQIAVRSWPWVTFPTLDHETLARELTSLAPQEGQGRRADRLRSLGWHQEEIAEFESLKLEVDRARYGGPLSDSDLNRLNERWRSLNRRRKGS